MNPRLALAALILVLTLAIMVAILLDMVNVGFFVGPYRFSHWMSWAGALWVALYVPAYHLLKTRLSRIKLLIDIHCFGFLIAFLLISIHFAGQMGRAALPELGEGIALYAAMVGLVATGMIQRFGTVPIAKRRYNPRLNRAVHVSLITAFYIVIVVHAATNAGLV
jgi:hypothetical protein